LTFVSELRGCLWSRFCISFGCDELAAKRLIEVAETEDEAAVLMAESVGNEPRVFQSVRIVGCDG
jgi:hypothetical protein